MPIYLGNLEAVRDWGHAKDYVAAMSLMLEADSPDDFVVATGIGHTVREFLLLACEVAGLQVAFNGTGLNETLIEKNSKKVIAKIDPRYFRPLEVDHLIGDSTKIRTLLGWKPTISFVELVTEMVESDMRDIKK
jgi:GDPmannose 4,6-dehydratase